eukprot:scaffold9367_cov37-Tisochrysis_lutea.AAC.1
MGLAAWLFPAEDALAANAAGTYGRLHYPVEAGRQISLLILGFQLFWDVPMTFTSAMYDPVMLVHHVGMLGCAVVSFMPYVQYYVPFFGGAIELSSVPLVIIDIFHPKRCAYTCMCSKARVLTDDHSHFGVLTPLLCPGPHSYQDVADSNPISAQANFFMRVIFLLSYLAIRCIWFPVVVFTEVLPDFLGELSSAANVSAAAAPIIGMLFILPLMFLQFYWGHLLIRQAIKALSAPPEMADDRVAKPTEMV